MQQLTTICRIGCVPWAKDYKNIQDYTSKNVQVDEISKKCSFVFENLNIIKRDEPFILKGVNSDLTATNYLMFKNPKINNKWFFAFIDKVEYVALDTVKIYHTLDIWQTYQFDVIYNKSLILRGIVAKADDTVGRYLAPEPISVQPTFTKEITDFSQLDWSPKFVLHTTSYYNLVTNKYEYSGTTDDELVNGEFGIFVENNEKLKEIIKNYGKKSPQEIAEDVGNSSGLKTWQSWINALFSGQAVSEAVNAINATTAVAEIQDHRDELIGIFAIPSWVKGNVTGSFASNAVKTERINASIDSNTLACSYTPRNKKMLTSTCRAFALFTNNGFKKVFRPELIVGQPIFTFRGTAMSTNSISCEFENYKNDSEKFCKLSYNCQSRFGYDANSAFDKSINFLQATLSTIGSVASVATGNPIGILYGANNLISNSSTMVDAVAQRGVSNGSTGDFFSIANGMATPRFIEISPTQAECRYIDDYFDFYGYQINEISNISKFMKTRSNWNYLQVANANLSLNAPNDDIEKFKLIFENGVTIWHKDFGNYEVSNI